MSKHLGIFCCFSPGISRELHWKRSGWALTQSPFGMLVSQQWLQLLCYANLLFHVFTDSPWNTNTTKTINSQININKNIKLLFNIYIQKNKTGLSSHQKQKTPDKPDDLKSQNVCRGHRSTPGQLLPSTVPARVQLPAKAPSAGTK